jgi:hypothetical protein
MYMEVSTSATACRPRPDIKSYDWPEMLCLHQACIQKHQVRTWMLYGYLTTHVNNLILESSHEQASSACNSRTIDQDVYHMRLRLLPRANLPSETWDCAPLTRQRHALRKNTLRRVLDMLLFGQPITPEKGPIVGPSRERLVQNIFDQHVTW